MISVLAKIIKANKINVVFSCCQNLDGSTSASQSTTLPNAANKKASKAPLNPLSMINNSINTRVPLVDCHIKLKKFLAAG